MITQRDVASLVPDVYAEFRQVVADGVMFFLEHLSGARLSGILAGQAALPADANPAQRLVQLLHECPALHKLGQVVARRRELGPGFRRRLQGLETMRPRIDLAEVRPAVLRELGDSIERYRMKIGEKALAEASVAIVIPFTWSEPGAGEETAGAVPNWQLPESCSGRAGYPVQAGCRPVSREHARSGGSGKGNSSGTAGKHAGRHRPAANVSERRAGVLKVLKPHAAEYLHEDLEILGRMADFLDERRAAYGLPPVEFREVFDEVRTILIHEIQVAGEQVHLAAAGQRYAGRRDVWVPRLYPFSTPNITAMERLDGVKVTDAKKVSGSFSSGGLSGTAHKIILKPFSLARTITRALIAEAVFSREERTIFHGDPHAGNLLAVPDGRLGVLDWSLTGELTRNDRVQMSQILAGALCGDRSRIAEAIGRLASGTAPHEAVRATVDSAMRQLRALPRPTLDWLMRLLDGAARAGVRFRPDLLLFRKSFFTLEGVVADLCPECSMEDFIAEVLMEEFAGEWPTRWLRPPFSRDYATHLSNADLFQIAAAAPMRMMGWWMGAR